MPIDDDRPYCQYAAMNGQRCRNCMCPEALNIDILKQQVAIENNLLNNQNDAT